MAQPLRADRGELSKFVNAVFGRTDGQGRVALRAFYDNKDSHTALHKAFVLTKDREEIVNKAASIIDKCASDPNSVVFCPPVCTFLPGSTRVRESDIYEGVAISIELDERPGEALEAVELALGPATLVVKSGGVWLNEDLDLEEDKLHAYWVLDVPAKGEAIARLKYARKLATSIAGGDRSNVPAVHPIRWPGSWHRKRADRVRLCSIVKNTGYHYALEPSIEKLKAVADSKGIGVNEVVAGARVDDRDTKELIHNVVTGGEFHDSLVPLAKRLQVARVPQETAVAILQGLMEVSQGPHDDRWRTRYADIGRTVGTAYAQMEMKGAPNWVTDLSMSRAGGIANDYRNLFAAFSKAPEFKDSVRKNRRTGMIEFHKPPPWNPRGVGARNGVLVMNDADATFAAGWLASYGFPKIKPHEIYGVVEAVAHAQGYDPLTAHLDALVWDGRPRVDTWLREYANVTGGDEAHRRYVDAVGRAWLIGAIARAYQPGCQMDVMLIFEGKQGLRKSSMVRTLAGRDEFFGEFTMDVGSSGKDGLLSLAGPWIMEMSELTATKKSEAEHIKQFISCMNDRYREPFGRATRDHPRGVVFAGTMNPSGAPYLMDTTGNRRFWPVEVESLIDTDKLAKDRDVLLAEAVELYRKGARWHITDPAVIGHAGAEQARRAASVEDDPWYGKVRDHVMKMPDPQIRVSEFLSEVLFVPDKDINNRHMQRVAMILSDLGFTRKHTNKGNVWRLDLGFE